MRTLEARARLTAGASASERREAADAKDCDQPSGHPWWIHLAHAVGNEPSSAENTTAYSRVPARKTPRAVRLLIVDDCMLYRDNLAAALGARGMTDIGFAWDLRTLVIAMQGNSVEVILLSIATRDSAALLNVAVATDPSVRVVVLGLSEDDVSGVIACAEAGVAGYHTRTESIDDLLAQIEAVAAGQTACSPRVSAILLQRLSALASRPVAAPKDRVLTAREEEILGMLESGMSNRDIAEKLCIAVHTVKNHVHSLLNKLGVANRAAAAAAARTQRLAAGDTS